MLTSLDHAVRSHVGQFHCRQIGNNAETKVVDFRHVASPPDSSEEIPSVQGLADFYSTFGQLTLYFDEASGDAAFYIARPSQWAALDGDFRIWLDGLSEEEVTELVPAWVSDCIVIGEIPQSGNYLLVPVRGAVAGRVYEFEHDGFKFIELADSLPEFVTNALDLGASELVAIASHLRFVTGGAHQQWWITELRDNRGNIVSTEG